MAKLHSLKLDVTKIDKSKLYKGKKGTYLNVTIADNDEENDYGQNVSCWIEQTQEERENNVPKIYLGNGKTVWVSNEINKINVNGNTDPFEETYKKATDKSILKEEDDLPF